LRVVEEGGEIFASRNMAHIVVGEAYESDSRSLGVQQLGEEFKKDIYNLG